jgi:hypothetical protein
LVNGAIIADFGGFSNHDPLPMVDKNSSTNDCAWVNFNSSDDPTKVSQKTCWPLEADFPEAMIDAVHTNSV